MTYYLKCAALMLLLIAELVGVYWMQTGSLPSPQLRVDDTVLLWGAAVALCGYMGITIWHS